MAESAEGEEKRGISGFHSLLDGFGLINQHDRNIILDFIKELAFVAD
jgi:hypothetical protein